MRFVLPSQRIPLTAHLLVLSSLLSHQALSQRSDPSAITASAISAEINLDGRLDEEPWQIARRISNFTQRELSVGEPVTERTEVAVLFDEDALYIGFWGFDSEPSGIRASEMARDFSWSGDDNFEVVLDPFNDDRTGYLFVTNPNGARADALIADNGGTVNRDWDGVWEVHTRRSEAGWFAEIRVPFSSLRYPAGSVVEWGINFERNIRRKREQVLWQGWSRDFDLERLSQAGSLVGLSGISGVTLVEARPFGIGGMEWRSGRERERVTQAGIDFSYLPTPNWKLNLTVRPDFAQVESDREEVNLTRFSLFFPEKRNFFLEGSEFFDFELGSDTRPLYSRRIGLADDRSEVPIDGGVRVLGKRGSMSLGGMLLRTAGTASERATDFGAARWKQDVLEESSVGVLVAGRRESGRVNVTYGMDLRYATSSMFGDKEFEATLSVAQSYTSDADQRFGLAHRLSLQYPNDLVEFSASWSRAGETFNPEVGFIRRRRFQRFASELAISPRPRFLPFVQQFEIKPFEFSWFVDDGNGEFQSLYLEFVPLAFTLLSGESFEFNVQRRGDAPDEAFELFEDEEIPADTYWFTRWVVEASSYRARPISGSFEVSGGEFYLGTRREYTLDVRWKASRHVQFSADYEHNRIGLYGDTFLVDEFATRVDYAFSPNMFGAIAGQWNSEDDEVILNFRLNWIPTPGSDLFIVINQLAEYEDAAWNPVRTTLLNKIVWRVAL